MKKQFFRLAISAMLLIAITACKEEQSVVAPTNLDAIQGQFMGTDNVPLANVIVEATDAEGTVFSTFTTDSKGNFEIKNLPAKSENAVVSFINNNNVLQQLKLSTIVSLAGEEPSAPGKSKKVTIFQGEEYDYNATVSVIVIDRETHKPVPEAIVTMATSENAVLQATTNIEGVALFEKLVPGRFVIRIQKDGYFAYEEGMLLLFPEGVDNLEFKFEIMPDVVCNDNIIKVKVLDGDAPIPNQKVFISSRNIAHVYTNDQGIATFENVTTGSYYVCVEAVTANGDSRCDSVFVGCQDTATAEIQIASRPNDPQDPNEPPVCCDNTIKVLAFNEDGTPRVDESIALDNIKTGELVTIVSTNSVGIALFENVCAGDYRAHVSRNSKFKTNVLKVACKTTKEAELIVIDDVPVDTIGYIACCNSILIIGFTMNNGNPIGEGATVNVYSQALGTDNETLFYEQTTNGNSHITLDGLCQGKHKYTVKVKKVDAAGNSIEYKASTVEVEFECNSRRSATMELIPQ